MKSCFALLLALLSGVAHAYCPDRTALSPDMVSLNADAVMIVTHASATYDPRFATKHGLDAATRFARQRSIAMVYLQDEYGAQDFFTEDCAPDYWVYSPAGELGFQVDSSRVYVAGGHLEQCLSRTVQDVIYSWAEHPGRDLELTFLMDAIYSTGDLVGRNDDYFESFNAFVRVLRHGHAGDDYYPKVTLLETMGVIGRQDGALEYLRRALPEFEHSLPHDYRVELNLNDSVVRVLKDAPAWNSPTLRFNFLDSAARLGGVEDSPAQGGAPDAFLEYPEN